MQEAGMTPMEVIVAATKGSATAMGRLGDLGTVERGKAADMLVLRADPTESVANFAELVLIVRGGIVRHQLELHAPER
jgi:imidazolonepropionase-like amidohydrolase